MAESSNEQPLHRRLGMTDEELAAVVSELGREPNHLELAMYSVMWSEHCSYKSSRAFLSRFPTEAPWVLVGPGEGAGVVDIGDGLAVAVRIESHNHPSAVEPYQGAATRSRRNGSSRHVSSCSMPSSRSACRIWARRASRARPRRPRPRPAREWTSTSRVSPSGSRE